MTTATAPRQCVICEKGMEEGYLFEPIGNTYCSIDCIGHHYGIAAAKVLIKQGDLFWTTWYDEL